MNNLDRFQRAVQKATRVTGGIALLLTAALLLILASMVFGWGASASQRDQSPGERGNGMEWQPIRESAIQGTIRGKAIFRTSRVRKRKTIDELAHYQLVGTSLRNGKAKAYVRDTRLKKMLIKRPGEELGSYELEKVSKGAVVLRRGNDEVVLKK